MSRDGTVVLARCFHQLCVQRHVTLSSAVVEFDLSKTGVMQQHNVACVVLPGRNSTPFPAVISTGAAIEIESHLNPLAMAILHQQFQFPIELVIHSWRPVWVVINACRPGDNTAAASRRLRSSVPLNRSTSVVTQLPALIYANGFVAGVVE